VSDSHHKIPNFPVARREKDSLCPLWSQTFLCHRSKIRIRRPTRHNKRSSLGISMCFDRSWNWLFLTTSDQIEAFTTNSFCFLWYWAEMMYGDNLHKTTTARLERLRSASFYGVCVRGGEVFVREWAMKRQNCGDSIVTSGTAAGRAYCFQDQSLVSSRTMRTPSRTLCFPLWDNQIRVCPTPLRGPSHTHTHTFHICTVCS
jgi:hypothetical protein